MKLFECQNCGQPLYFENTQCESCGLCLGYLPLREIVTALRPDQGAWRALAAPANRYRYCANYNYDACNWLIHVDNPEQYCAACRHNRTIPDLSQPDNLAHWRKVEIAKHRLFYTILKLRLPLTTRTEDPRGLAFDLIAVHDGHAAGPASVMTGHSGGLITINLAEADDSERERQRRDMDEPYRTLLGHFRHEIAHYYWDQLVANSPSLDEFRNLFGDERKDYATALQQHYLAGAPPDWPAHFVSAYASVHPWEDFAETWAHYFHMVDTLETARAFALSTRPNLSKRSELSASIDFDPHHAPLERIIEAWLPLTFAMNSMNRSMGMPDLYPFILAPPAIVKLTFVHERIHAHRGRRSVPHSALRAVISGLRRKIAAPDPT
jgi:hypothetical protein